MILEELLLVLFYFAIFRVNKLSLHFLYFFSLSLFCSVNLKGWAHIKNPTLLQLKDQTLLESATLIASLYT